MMLANVKIEQDKDDKYIHRVFVDGKQIEKITHLDFQVNSLEIPQVTLNLDIITGIDFEGQAEVNFLKTPFTVENACKVLREELLRHGDLYKAFSASIYSALNDIPEGMFIDEMPEIILKRIIGEE